MPLGSGTGYKPVRKYVSAKLSPTATWRSRTWPGPGLPTATSSQRRTSGPPAACMRIACAICGSLFMGASGHFAQEALLPTLRVGREAVGRQRFLDRVVEDADLAD